MVLQHDRNNQTLQTNICGRSQPSGTKGYQVVLDFSPEVFKYMTISRSQLQSVIPGKPDLLLLSHPPRQTGKREKRTKEKGGKRRKKEKGQGFGNDALAKTTLIQALGPINRAPLSIMVTFVFFRRFSLHDAPCRKVFTRLHIHHYRRSCSAPQRITRSHYRRRCSAHNASRP